LSRATVVLAALLRRGRGGVELEAAFLAAGVTLLLLTRGLLTRDEDEDVVGALCTAAVAAANAVDRGGGAQTVVLGAARPPA